METIKEEKKADLEQLLNSLIEKGWKPFGNCNRFDFRDLWLYYFANNNGRWSKYPLRMLVSKESWLWQFVCENGMINNVWNFMFRRLRDGKKFWLDKPITHFTYRLMESALCDEDKLEDFILSNIAIKDEK